MSTAAQQTGDIAPDMLAAALEYAHRGLAVFPLYEPGANGTCSCSAACKSPGKHPRTSNGLKAATTDEEQIRSWWTTWPSANVGIATGAVSAIVVVDVDGAEGEESLRRMTEKYGPLPTTMKVKTGGGYHLYFKHPGRKIKSKASFCDDYPYVDSRGDGGYVVAPPSLHHTGVHYAADPTMPSVLADGPAWLIDLINGKQKGTSVRAVAAANDSIADGSRNSTLASMAGSMRAKGFAEAAIEAALLAYNRTHCDPPLDDDEVR